MVRSECSNGLPPRLSPPAVLTQIVAANSAPESSTCTIDGEQATAKRCCENQIMWLRNESRAGTPLMVHGWEVGTPEFFLAVRADALQTSSWPSDPLTLAVIARRS